MDDVPRSIRVSHRAAEIIHKRTNDAGGCYTDAEFCDDVAGCKCLVVAREQAEKDISAKEG